MIEKETYRKIAQLIFETHLKLNANCKAEEKNGSGPGSCGGATKDEKSLEKERKINLKGVKDELKITKAINEDFRTKIDALRKSKHLEYTSKDPEHVELMSKLSKSVSKEYDLEDKVRELSYVHPKAPDSYKPILDQSDSIIKASPIEAQNAIGRYIHGYGNTQWQYILAKNNGEIPTAESLAKELTDHSTSYMFEDEKKGEKYENIYKENKETATRLISELIHIDNVITKSVIPTDVTIFTGVPLRLYAPLETEIKEGYKTSYKITPGTEFQINTLVSTSRDPKVAMGFAAKKFTDNKKDAVDKYQYADKKRQPTMATYLEVHLKSGSKALALENYATEVAGKDAQWVVGSKGSAGTGNQQELLIGRKTKCVVKEVQETTFRGRPIRKIVVDATN